MNSDLHYQRWIWWPEREDLSLEFTRLLASAQEGGATFSECWLTASRIDFTGDDGDDSWHREWTATAEVNRGRALSAAAQGHPATARSNWLRAINYYLTAAYAFDLSPDKRRSALASMRECAANYLNCREPRGEVVSIPWLSEFALQGYYLPAPASGDAAPVVICIGEPGHHKEEFLFKLARHASERGMALLAVDILGDDTGLTFEEVSLRHKPEHAIAPIMDYLIGRDDVDERRIAILAYGWSSSFVARGIAFDHRFAAAVCDGGIWDLHLGSFLDPQNRPFDVEPCPELQADRILMSIKCPLLVAASARGGLKADRIAELTDRLRAGRGDRDVTVEISEGTETAAGQGRSDNPILANEFIFDWIASRIGAQSLII
ncbi:dienelactone hydrolase [Bradyrhizobium sp. BRP22]|nr:dienelactone hydrolase [Bradyrhizobium sp. BRP22]